MLSERDEFLSFLARVAREGGLIIILGICAFLLLSLFSYNANDPGWSHLGTIDHTFNMAGPVGAWVADFLYAMLGVVAIVPPIMLLLLAFFGFRKSVDDVVSSIPFWTFRIIGAVIFVITAAALASLHFTSTSLQVPFGAGGMLGLSAAKYCADLFGLIGATLVLFTFWLLGVTLFTHLSWLALADRVGYGLLVGFHFLREHTQAILVKGVESNSRRKEDKKTAASAPGQASKPAKPATQAKVEPVFDLGVGADVPEPAQSGKAESLFSMFASPAKESADSVPVLDEPLTAPAAEVLVNAPVADKHLKIVPLSETVKPTQNDDDDEPYAASKPRRATKSNAKPLPDMDLLDKAEKKHGQGYTPEQLESMSRLLEAKLQDFGVQAEVVEVNPGPVITRFEIQPAPGTKVSKISNLSKDLARSMAVLSVRVVEVIAGKSVVGIEIPNEDREIVRLSEVLTSKAYSSAESKLSLALGNDIAGNPVVVNLAKMPHLLVAGTTGSGKSVGVNAMLLSLLYKATPEEVRLMMVDPKMLELSIYDGIPHLLTPVITDMKEAASGLRWCVAEMERRYRLMAKMGVRNLAGFNSKVREAQDAGQPIPDPLWNAVEEGFDENAPAPFLEPLPYIVVVIDEFADMMMIVGKKVEELIARIAQKARAAGIHLILATQRPSVDVITGLIKANVPTRIAFQVSSKIDSRTILDQGGAESLLGHGDMLYLPAGTSMPARVHGAFVADDEVHRVVEAWKKWGPPEFVEEILMANVDMDTTGGSAIGGGLSGEEEDPLYDEAVAFVTQTRRASISSVQRKLKIGYNRAARMVEVMEAAGVVSEAGNNGSREVLAPPPVGMD